MNTIYEWYKKYSVGTHVIAALVFLAGAFSYVPEFHSLIMAMYAALPAGVKTGVVVALALYAWYRKGEPRTVQAKPVESGSSIKLGAWVLIALLLMGTMPVTGCTQNQITQTENFVNVVLQAASNFETVLQPGSAVALALPGAIAGLKAAEANFAAGTGTETLIANAALAVEEVIAGVDPNSKAALLAALLTTALDGLLAILPTPAVSLRAGNGITRTYNYHGQDGRGNKVRIARSFSIAHPLGNPAQDFTRAWNRAAKKAALPLVGLK